MTIVRTMANGKNRTKTANKNDRIYVRLNEQVKRDFELIAAYRGLKTSALIHSLIVQTIHKAREEKPELFKSVVDEREVETGNSRLSEKLIARKNNSLGTSETFTTGDGKTFQLVNEGTDDT